MSTEVLLPKLEGLVFVALPDQIDSARRAHVEDVNLPVREFRQHDVAVDHDVFGDAGHAADAEAQTHLALVHHAAFGQFQEAAALLRLRAGKGAGARR